jgi:exodeoxyribonuclease-5
MQLSEDQQVAVDTILAWYFDDQSQTLTMGGYAGTGKTTVISHLLELFRRTGVTVAVCAFTGKAASNLRRKGVSQACTMHSLLYVPQDYCAVCMVVAEAPPKDPDEERPRKSKPVCSKCKSGDDVKTRWITVPMIGADLVIVDEASMLSHALVEDLEALASRVLYVGDHGQLEPIGKDPGLMRDPKIKLERIHRQAEDSPIIRFAHSVRCGNVPASWIDPDPRVCVRVGIEGVDMASFDAILCGYNRTRVGANRKVRALRGHTGLLNERERIICLHNDKNLGVFNGMLLTVTGVHGHNEGTGVVLVDVEDEDGKAKRNLPLLRTQFGRESKLDPRSVPNGVAICDYGYAMTAHKSQGSEWPKVAVLEQIASSWTATRWRYTAATRASDELTYFVSRMRR